MKTKLKIFKAALITFILIYLTGIVLYFVITFTGGKTIPNSIFRGTWLSEFISPNFYLYFSVDVIKDVFLVFALIQLLRVTDLFIKAEYFTPKTIRLLRFSGRALVIIAIIGFLNSLFYNFVFSKHIFERMVFPTMYHFMTFLLGFGLLIIEETYNKGLLLKTENELTI